MAIATCSLGRLVIAILCTSILLGLVLHSKPEVVPSLETLQSITQNLTGIDCKAAVVAPSHTKPTRLEDRIHSLFGTIRQSLTDDYVDSNGQKFGLKNTPQWRKPLGKRILVVDIDTREPNGGNEILNSVGMSWERLQMGGGQLVSGAILGHYLYAQIHGYDYKFFQAKHMEGYHDTWILPGSLRALIGDYDFIITMDADVTITHPEVPFEWLLNHWGVTNNTSIAMPLDQKVFDRDEINSVDSKGAQVLNTGVVVVQNIPYTLEMLDAWIECPNESKYPGCGHWKDNWSHEQRVFSEFIRYDFNPDGDNIVEIPCDDAMGYPNMMQDYPGMILNDCKGNFFRHHTLNKGKAKDSLGTSIMQLVIKLLHDSVLEHKDSLWHKQKSYEA